ncbi:polypeptide-transport-associated domain protein ShlB-type [Arthrospira platensis C1]|nr:polypeptide-transport-associated domain protein ShlB-type [Arthrospira platensis C1]
MAGYAINSVLTKYPHQPPRQSSKREINLLVVPLAGATLEAPP